MVPLHSHSLLQMRCDGNWPHPMPNRLTGAPSAKSVSPPSASSSTSSTQPSVRLYPCPRACRGLKLVWLQLGQRQLTTVTCLLPHSPQATRHCAICRPTSRTTSTVRRALSHYPLPHAYLCPRTRSLSHERRAGWVNSVGWPINKLRADDGSGENPEAEVKKVRSLLLSFIVMTSFPFPES